MTANRARGLLHSLFAFAVKEDRIAANPVSNIDAPLKETPRERIATAAETVVVIDLVPRATSDDELPEPLRPKPDGKTAPVPVLTGAEAVPLALGGATATVSDIPADATHGEGVETELPARLCQVPGLVGEIADWIVATSRKPQPAHALAMAVCLVGTAAGRKYCGPTQSATHLFMLCTGPTGSGKNAPKKAAGQLLAAAGLQGMLGPSSFASASALIQHVAEVPCSLCVMDEFSMLIAKINSKNGSSHEKAISGEMRQFWSLSFEEYAPPKWARGRERVQLAPIVSPALSIIGLTTADELYSVLQGADVLSGLRRIHLGAGRPRHS